MVDPGAAAASAATRSLVQVVTKRLVSKGGTRLGGREERREVYRRFQDALIEASTLGKTWRLETQLGGFFMSTRRRRVLQSQLNEQTAEVLKAYAELRLVANPEPLAKGDDALTAVMDSLGTVTDADADKVDASDVRVGAALREFTDACRDDLWYLPRWWQIHRRIPLWWKAWKNRRAENSAAERPD
ncbi:hypothetical protein ACH4UR_25255 [Streptomyces lydicus]|uniref:hypothetical protein n=1 Tax=Streptomyces lydicus TaxID=47763 RepID=UPI0033F6AD52